MTVAEQKFLADLGLPGVAKHLRILGVDCVCDPKLTPGYMVYQAQKEDRIIITKSISLKNRCDQHNFRVKRDGDSNYVKYYWVNSLGAKNQITEVVDEFKIKFFKEKLFRKCVQCNGDVKQFEDKIAVKGKVPDNVFDENEKFAECQNCLKITYGTEDGNKIHQKCYDETIDYVKKYSYHE